MLRHNNHVFMTKELRKEIKTRSKLKTSLATTKIMKIGAIMSFRKFYVLSSYEKRKSNTEAI